MIRRTFLGVDERLKKALIVAAAAILRQS